MKIVPNQFADIFDRYGLPESVVNSTCMYGKQLFVATDSGLIVLEDRKPADSVPITKAVTASGVGLEVTDLLDYLDGVRIRSIIRDSKGRLWIATWRKHGLVRYDNGELMTFTEEDGLFSDRVRVVCERSDGAIMVANTGGVSIIKGDQIVESHGSEAGIMNGEILTVAEGMNGDILLGSDGGGIYVLGSAGTRHIGVEDGLSSEVVMRIKRDTSRDVFWMATSNSISFMDADYHV
jgi:energy-coupling factor transport system substrate-specific component